MCKRRLRRKQCTGKVKHTTYKAAFMALKRSGFPGDMRVYKCRFCSGYHIGHYNKQKADQGRYGL